LGEAVRVLLLLLLKKKKKKKKEKKKGKRSFSKTRVEMAKHDMRQTYNNSDHESDQFC